MSDLIEELVEREYAYGFHSDLDTDLAPKGMTEAVVRLISAKKTEPAWLLGWRLGGLFEQAQMLRPLVDQIEVLCREHADLHRWLADGPTGGHLPEALRLLATHIDDEEYDLFPHIFHALDPEQWDEIELAHRAIEAVWDDAEPASPAPAPANAATG